MTTKFLVADHIDGAIRELLQTKTIHKPDKITECLKYCSDTKIWDELVKHEKFKNNYPNANALRDQLNSIVERRNQIVHQSDLALAALASINDEQEKWSPTKISKQDLQVVREFIESFIRGVDRIINNHSG
ncbi:MAG: HEPN domain-containing protein [Alphaproteobacteria bacterium]|nr:HEPN domain-containing protein [Alphaproteobacteria bacterium]